MLPQCAWNPTCRADRGEQSELFGAEAMPAQARFSHRQVQGGAPCRMPPEACGRTQLTPRELFTEPAQHAMRSSPAGCCDVEGSCHLMVLLKTTSLTLYPVALDDLTRIQWRIWSNCQTLHSSHGLDYYGCSTCFR